MATTVPAYDTERTAGAAGLGALSGAASGAMAGAAGGVPGVIIGGLIGAAVGGVTAGASDAAAQKGEIKAAKAKKSEETAASIDAAANTRVAGRQAALVGDDDESYLTAATSGPYTGGTAFDTWSRNKGF